MKRSIQVICSFLFIFFTTVFFSSFTEKRAAARASFPYKKAGLTERQAAAHLLSRFTYGSRSGDVDAVVKVGLEKWFRQQLDAKLPEDSLNQLLSKFEDLNLSNAQAENKYPNNGKVLRMAIKDGVLNKDSVSKADPKTYREQVKAYMDQHGLKPEQELFRQFINQKILRAAYANNQLQEMLTDFWFNHFNVSITKNQCALFIPAYERDVIRPNVTAKFQDLLMATAKSPAMLIYLDNFTSTGQQVNMAAANKPNAQPVKKKAGGLNENYAREVMELHTLGVDGGYTQSDVTQAARVLTGWTIAPMGEDGYGAAMKKIIDNVGEENLVKRGFVRDGDFLFVPGRHDNEEKTVLGKNFPAGGGYDEGVTLLSMLAHHPSTAKFISRKLAVRFVNDNPAQSLIDKMAKTFMRSDGDIKAVLLTMVNAPEFWSPAALREKTKSPFELAISALRSLDAEINQPYQVFNWVNRMGQKMYYYQAPTGFPDRGQYWINTGSLLNRMNFGLALAAQRIPGIKINLAALNHNHEPESAEAALLTYGKMIMPERDLTETVKRLKPMLNDPSLMVKVANAAERTTPATMPGAANVIPERTEKDKNANNVMLAQVVGVIIGSPEFQRK